MDEASQRLRNLELMYLHCARRRKCRTKYIEYIARTRAKISNLVHLSTNVAGIEDEIVLKSIYILGIV